MKAARRAAGGHKTLTHGTLEEQVVLTPDGSEPVRDVCGLVKYPSPQAHDHMATSGAVHGWEKTGVGKQTNLNDVVVRMASASTRSTPTTADARCSGKGARHNPLNQQAKTADSAWAWPTPTASDHKGANLRAGSKGAGDILPASSHSLATKVAASVSARPTPTAHAARNPSPNEKNRDGLNFAVERGTGKRDRTVGWARPTPCATDSNGSGGTGEDRDRLDYAVERGRTKSHTYPTPTCTDVKYSLVGNSQRSTCLGAPARRGQLDQPTYPTPRCKDMCGGTGAYNHIKQLHADCVLDAEEAAALGANVGGPSGQLNPDWVEWLMNWPVGWTNPTASSLWWLPPEDDPAELEPAHPLYLTRTTHRKEYRVKRIVTLGNGQVPLCASVAFTWGLEVLEAIFANI